MEMPLETAPEYLPDGAEVWFSGCLSGATSIVDTLMVERDGEAIRYQSK